MSIGTMSRVWEASGQKGSALLLLLAISDYADDNGVAWPAIDTLAKKIRINPRNTRRLIKKLHAAGEIRIIDRPGLVSVYILTAGLTTEMERAGLARATAYGIVTQVTGDRGGGVTGDRGDRSQVTYDPSLPVRHPSYDDDDMITDNDAKAIKALQERGWNAGEAKAAQFVETHGGGPYILAICAHARAHKLRAGWIRKNAGSWQPSKNGDGDRDHADRADRQRYISGPYADSIEH